MKRVVVAALLIVAVVHFCKNSEVRLGPGVRAPLQPIQTAIKETKYIPYGDYTIVPLAKFGIRAKVLSKENYHFGRESDLSPVDLALGWGRMSDESVLKDIEISQSGRWYHWRSSNLPIPSREIETHSANMHIIPANDTVRSKLKRIRKGDVIEMNGSLVRIFAPDGWRWRSSLSRLDTGGGACEIVYVEKAEIKSTEP